MQQFARILTDSGVVPIILKGNEHLDLRPIVSDITPDAIADGTLASVDKSRLSPIGGRFTYRRRDGTLIWRTADYRKSPSAALGLGNNRPPGPPGGWAPVAIHRRTVAVGFTLLSYRMRSIALYERIDSRPAYCARALPHGERDY
jgi:hypothetical protein